MCVGVCRCVTLCRVGGGADGRAGDGGGGAWEERTQKQGGDDERRFKRGSG